MRRELHVRFWPEPRHFSNGLSVYRQTDEKRAHLQVGDDELPEDQHWYLFEDIEPTSTLKGPSFSISDQAAQNLFDDLWRGGFRPSREADNRRAEGALEATKHHLEDVRAIAFDKLRIEKPCSKSES